MAQQRQQRSFSARQLATWLGLAPRHVRRAETRGLIPPPDVDDERWSEAAARELPDRVPEIRAAVADAEYEAEAGRRSGDAPGTDRDRDGDGDSPTVRGSRRAAAQEKTFGPHQLARELGLRSWQVRRAVLRGLLPPPGTDTGRWTEETAAALGTEADRVREVLGDHPGFGAVRAAEELARSTGLAVERADVGTLVDRGVLEPADTYRGHPLYSVDSMAALPRERVAEAVDERERWFAQSLTAKEAAALLGWAQGTFEVTAARRGVEPGAYGRFAREDVTGLTERGPQAEAS